MNIFYAMKLAVLCYIRNNGRTLMMHRNSRPEDMHFGKWNAPGGKVEPGETPEECAVREVFEETALTVNDLFLRGVLTFPAFDDEEDWYVFVFTAENFSGVLKKSCHEGDLFWIKNGELMDLPLWEGDHIFMKWLDSSRFFSGKFVYNTSGLQSHSVVFYGDDPDFAAAGMQQ
ncbi:MAG: 8-oxo-dGTP diphosphatase [Candidatus Fermentibacteraceae bacterium]|nr:8-oxo-dGTP diphosphatase [Candidatus Fermentibacteraceae bacterium]